MISRSIGLMWWILEQQRRWVWLMASIACAFVTFSLVSSSPWAQLGSEVWMPKGYDPTKGLVPFVLHLGCYMGLAALVALLPHHAKAWLAALVAHAGLTELLQIWIPGRESNFGDLFTNLAGISLGWWLCTHLTGKLSDRAVEAIRRRPTPE